LTGQTLDISGNPLKVGDSAIHTLSKQTTLFSRYVLGDNVEDEAAFLEDNHKQLVSMGIQPKKMMPGLLHRINTANGELDSRTLMLADLTIKDSIRLQQSGLGTGRKLGCGIFIPHKGIDPVGGAADK
jgi:CRISPR-associated protein Cas6